MKNYYKVMFWVSEGTLLLSIFDYLTRLNSSLWKLVLIIILGILLLINDLNRNYRMGISNKRAFSILFSLAGAMVILMFDLGFALYYFFSLAAEGIYQKKPWNKIILTLHFICYLYLLFGSEFYRHSGGDIANLQRIIVQNTGKMIVLSVIYFVSIFSFYATKELQAKKWEAEKLNRVLQDNNAQLKEYSEEIERLTISKERDRVASELHDTLGHSLTALIMHLDFLEKVLESDLDRAKELTQKTQGIARESMTTLRKAVYALKEEGSSLDLSEEIQALINNITAIDGITVDYVNNGELEDVPFVYKGVIYKIIQESITNGLRHGRATHFDININVDENIKIVTMNNGSSCTSIQRGNGLLGIEEGVCKLKGSINYLNNFNGFGIEVLIPM